MREHGEPGGCLEPSWSSVLGAAGSRHACSTTSHAAAAAQKRLCSRSYDSSCSFAAGPGKQWSKPHSGGSGAANPLQKTPAQPQHLMLPLLQRRRAALAARGRAVRCGAQHWCLLLGGAVAGRGPCCSRPCWPQQQLSLVCRGVCWCLMRRLCSNWLASLRQMAHQRYW